ncbi:MULTISPECIES: LuxR family transcriptional regulator [Actinomycetes]|uniref:helix-turn-helix transcriptional regulator n=1 Tax=Actinomycetes TaxID=1760 RepID=UPI0004C288E5|nr:MULTISPECIES: LuxR family transcriptional regulator [Actinomycetes]
MRSATVCVGRDEELRELVEYTALAAHGGSVVVTISGERGIGKSTLVRRLAEGHEGAVWFARSAPWEADTAGAMLDQLFQRDFPDNAVDAAATLRDFLSPAGVSEDTVLVVIDDAEFADQLSLQALVSASRHHRELPLLVVFTVTDRSTTLHDYASEHMALLGLSPAGIVELAATRGRVMHPAMARKLGEHTGGNPWHTMALLDELSPAVWSQPSTPLPAPAHVVDHVREQLARCGSKGRALIEAIAILGDAGSLTEAAVLAGSDEPLAAVDDARTTGLLTDVLEPWPTYEVRLCDSLTAAAVLAVMGARAAGLAHRQAAEVVADRVRSLTHRVRATATPDAALADEVEALARERGTDGAWSEAAGLYREASRLSLDPGLHDRRLTRTADSLVAAGDITSALALVPAIEALRETPLRDAVLAYLAIVRGRAAEAELRLGRAWDIVNIDRDPETAALIAQRYVLHSLSRCRGTELVRWADQALKLAEPESPTGIEAEAIRGLGLGSSGRADLAADAYRSLTRRVQHGVQAQRVTLGRGWLQLAQDDLDGARTSLETTVATAHMGGSARITLWAYGWLARVQFLTGEWDEALRTVGRGRQLAESSGIVLATPLLLWTLAQISALRGDWDDAKDAARAAGTVTQDYEIMRAPGLLAHAHIAEAGADYGAVIRTLDPVRRMSPGTALGQPGFWPWADVLANALVIDGRLDAAEAFLLPHEELAQETGHRSAQARLGYARGRLLGANGDLNGARHTFERALALLDGLPLRYDLARVNFAYGQTLRRAGKRREADPVLTTARDIYSSLGADTYVRRCDRELRAGGVHAKLPRGELGLTPQEEAVTRLVSQGLSNREVAAELYVSPKTVQYHLTRIYGKLGVRSRVDLAKLRL